MSKLIFFQFLLILVVHANQNNSHSKAEVQHERSHVRFVARPHQRVPHPLPRNRPRTPHPPARRPSKSPVPHPLRHREPAPLPAHEEKRLHPESHAQFPKKDLRPHPNTHITSARKDVRFHPKTHVMSPKMDVRPHPDAHVASTKKEVRFHPKTHVTFTKKEVRFHPKTHVTFTKKDVRFHPKSHIPFSKKELRFHPKSHIPFSNTVRKVNKQTNAGAQSAYKRRVINGVVTLLSQPISPADFSVDFNPLFSSQEFSSSLTQPAQAIPSSSSSLVSPPAFEAPAQETQQLSTFQAPPYRAAAPHSLLEKEELLNSRIFSLFRELNVTSFILKTEEFSVRALVSPVRTQFIPIEDQQVAAFHGFGIDRLRREQTDDYQEYRRTLNRKNKKKSKKNKKQKNSRHVFSSDLPYEPLYSDGSYSRYNRNMFGNQDDRSRFYNYNGPNTYISSGSRDFKKKV